MSRDRAPAMEVVPRVWISAKGEVIDLDKLDLSHGMAVARDPERFGLPAGCFDAHLDEVNDGNLDVPFDFDAAISMAQSAGWARTACDARSGIAVSAGSPRAAQKAVRWLVQQGVDVSCVDVEISRIEGDRIVAHYYRLDPVTGDRFIRYGRLPRAERYELPVQMAVNSVSARALSM